MSLASSLSCPLCQHPLQPTPEQPNSIRCDSNHCFDRARQGYYHLLPVQQKRSRAPGDDAEMVSGRRDFLNQQHYQPLSDAINQLLIKHLNTHDNQPYRILDCGCGEGYYSARLETALEKKSANTEIIGLDISKPAIRAACQRSKNITWVVASSRDIPVSAHSQDALLCLFAPHNSSAFHHTLKNNGLLLIATTGSDHLLELRQQIYPQVKRTAFNPLRELEQQFEALEQQNVSYLFELHGSETILQLLAMTPHQWRTTPEARARLQQLDKLQLTLDINLQLFRARRAPSEIATQPQT